MLEGLWIVEFLTPQDSSMDRNGAVIVIESGRILGGDSGYYYVGGIQERRLSEWPVSLKITRHDPDTRSVFGDVDAFDLLGSLKGADRDPAGRNVLLLQLSDDQTGIVMTAKLTKVSELP